MIYNHKNSQQIAKHLLKIGAVKINIQDPFTWTSGMKSPVYCDNRLTLQHKMVRNLICKTFKRCLEQNFPQTEVLAAVATAGIPHGAILAHITNLPLVYVRSDAKKWGLKNQIEGQILPGQKVVVIEDLISTAKSSIATIQALEMAKADVTGLMSIFSYELKIAQQSLQQYNFSKYSLCNYKTLQELNPQLPNLED